MGPSACEMCANISFQHMKGGYCTNPCWKQINCTCRLLFWCAPPNKQIPSHFGACAESNKIDFLKSQWSTVIHTIVIGSYLHGFSVLLCWFVDPELSCESISHGNVH